VGARQFLFSIPAGTSPGTLPASTMGTGVFREVKSAEVANEYSYTSTPHLSSWHVIG